MTLQELGQSIQSTREAAGMSLDDVSSRIKISSRILKSIEEGSLVGLPHAVYTKSFIRAFGLHVGYDPEALNAALEEIFPQDSLDETRSEPTFKNHAAMQYPGGAGKRFAALIVVLLILAGLVGGGWYVAVTYGDQILDLVKKPFSAVTAPTEGELPMQNGNTAPATSSTALSQTLQALSDTGRQPSRTAVHSAPDRGAPPESAAPAGFLSSSAAHSPASAGVAASGPGADPFAPGAHGAGERDADSAGVSAPDAGAPQGDQAPGGANGASRDGERPDTPVGSNRLVILAEETCWVGSKADDALGRDYTLRPGERFTLTYARTLEVTLGNAGGVVLVHNGKTLGNAGQRGRRVVLRFPEAGR